VDDRASDEILVRRFLDGDQPALDVLVKRHEARVYNLCLRVLGDPEDARDASQDAFVSAIRKLGQFRGDAAFTTWMHRVAVNACYDILRKRQRQPMLRVVNEDGPEADLGPPSPDHADEVSGSTDVATALARVPQEFRVVLVLADVQDMPYEQIAAVLDVPVGTVKSRVHRGRLALAREMGLDRKDRDASAREGQGEDQNEPREPAGKPQPSKDTQ
jgi:RNA polymerase sigma-70 factor, ECF subfamily